jgi:hypothetical protein
MDIPATLAYYTGKLGFACLGTWLDPPVYAIVARDQQSKTTKADLAAALKGALAYCDKAYDGMTDASGAQMVKLFGMDMPKFGVLNINNAHDMEPYGNLVTYMRMKNIVPPSSEQPPAAPQRK